jgi:purine nucleosidase
MVFGAGVPLTMFGLNLTHQALALPGRVARFRNLGTQVGEFTAQLLEFFRTHHIERYGWQGAPIHDACAVAFLIRPELFRTGMYAVDVEANDGLAFGRTVCDYWRVTKKAANCEVALEVDVEGFYDLLVERIGTYS